MGSDFDEIFAPKNQHSYVKVLWASGGFINLISLANLYTQETLQTVYSRAT